MKQNHNHPDSRQLLADLLAGNTLARRQLSGLRKPIKWLSGQCISQHPEPLPTDEVQTSITYRDGTVKPNHALPYAEFLKLEAKAQESIFFHVTSTSEHE